VKTSVSLADAEKSVHLNLRRREQKAHDRDGTGGAMPQRNSNWRHSRINPDHSDEIPDHSPLAREAWRVR
jgi:hypothetical protein